MSIKIEQFGMTPHGDKIRKFTIRNSHGITATVINLGSTLTSLKMPDRKGKVSEITLGFDHLRQYLDSHFYFGATIGRFANRIAYGTFTLNGIKYYLPRNENDLHHLHGGIKGFDKVVWQGADTDGVTFNGVAFSYLSPDGEEGYPGNLMVKVIYVLNEDDELKIEYQAQTDKPTIINLTNHTYWNLAGAGSGTIMNHKVILNSIEYIPVDKNLIPTGEIKPAKGTSMDFTRSKRIGKDFAETDGGYDHCFVINRLGKGLHWAAKLYEPGSGRLMEILTTAQGIQFYSGNFIEDTIGAGGALFQRHGGLCLETGNYPNAINESKFPSPVLYPGNTYYQETIYRFSAR